MAKVPTPRPTPGHPAYRDPNKNYPIPPPPPAQTDRYYGRKISPSPASPSLRSFPSLDVPITLEAVEKLIVSIDKATEAMNSLLESVKGLDEDDS